MALPPLVLAGFGVTHPVDLTPETAPYWRDLHIVILAVFPLLGFSPWLVLRGRTLWVSIVAAVLGFVYAAFYTALDVLNGIGAGSEEHAFSMAGGDMDGMNMAKGTLFGIGSDLGRIGSWAFIAAAAFATVVAIRRWNWWAALPGAVLIVGAVLFLLRHIYFPVGVVGQLCIAAGWVGMLLVARRAQRTVAS